MHRHARTFVSFALASLAPLQAQEVLLEVVGDSPSNYPGLGRAVDGGVDLGGDGVPDVAVGAPYENGLLGRARVVSGADGATLAILESARGGLYGYAVGLVGDTDGDGVSEVVVGAPEITKFAPATGYADLRSGAGGAVLFRWEGLGTRSHFGREVAAVGDVDGDGTPDVLVGAPEYDTLQANAGMVRVLSGATGAVLVTRFGAAAGDSFGSAVAGVGDLNGDGLADYAVGAPSGGPLATGRVQVFSGAGGLLHTFAGVGGFDSCGESVAGAGDVDLDGVPDVLYGCPGAGAGGAAVVRSGADGGLLLELAGGAGAGGAGQAVAGLGDVDADGWPDVVLTDHFAGGGGRAWVHSGRHGALLATLGEGAATGDRLGFVAARAGDLDADGFADVLVGADGFGGPDVGHALVFSGEPSFRGSVPQIDLSTGGSLVLDLDAGTGAAGHVHWVLGSASGTAPGTTLLGASLPLVADAYFQQTLLQPFSSIFTNTLGVLDASGRGTAAVTLPAGTDPALAGLEVWHAYVAAPGIAGPYFVSNPVAVDLVP